MRALGEVTFRLSQRLGIRGIAMQAKHSPGTYLAAENGTNVLAFGKFITMRSFSGRDRMRASLDLMLNNPFLKDLTAEQYDLLSGLFEPFAVPARTVIFRQGSAATHLYLILLGSVVMRYKPYDGPKITLTDLQPGGIFGWSSVLGHDAYTSDAVSTTRVETLRLRGTDLRSLCGRHPDVGRGILEKLAKAVAPRWVNAREQVQEVLKESVRSTS